MREVAYQAITTNLYDVISALHTQMNTEDDQIITAMVSRLIQDGQLTFCCSWPTDHDGDVYDDDECRSDVSTRLKVL